MTQCYDVEKRDRCICGTRNSWEKRYHCDLVRLTRKPMPLGNKELSANLNWHPTDTECKNIECAPCSGEVEYTGHGGELYRSMLKCA
jgi:hypothetical protein